MPLTIVPRDQLAEQVGRKFGPGEWVTIEQSHRHLC
jgi:hypothetical protein